MGRVHSPRKSAYDATTIYIYYLGIGIVKLSVKTKHYILRLTYMFNERAGVITSFSRINGMTATSAIRI